ncbi:cyclin-D5-1-like [Hordeum vulgare subsp. vulgare]|uniref:Cyclin-like domain-containing protein n=1 Tax=Hordeum vulgare subsp. vulgare TaxID=112509 RepID=A0A8I6XCN8_HORVV|nr:cyclin-D5-1-like [Hordeum vulgare subsp. vulgare]KAI4997886.1 hypothetical protein ZWY2020_053228 [Hordeum vulgare]
MEAEDYAAGCCFSLMCQEDGADLLGDGFADEDGGKLLLMYSAGDDNDGEEDEEGYMDHLVSKESSFYSADPSPSMASEDWFQCARRDTVRWILETRGHFGFCHRTAYVAIAYFDRFSLRRCVDRSVMPWAARLLAIACVSLAAKMDECQAPALSEFRADDDYDFSCDSIRRMEVLVLSTLDWRMGAVTPFDYLPCLSSRLRRFNGAGRGGGGGLIAVKAAALIFSAAEVASVLDYRPSTVAAVAVLAATHGVLTREPLESKINSLSPTCLLEKEDVYACYTMMLRDPSSPSKTAKRPASDRSDGDSTYARLDAASFSVAAAMNNNKRVRLELPAVHR